MPFVWVQKIKSLIFEVDFPILHGFYADFTQILWGFYLNFTWILSRFLRYADFIQIVRRFYLLHPMRFHDTQKFRTDSDILLSFVVI